MSAQQRRILEQIVKLQRELLTFEVSNDRLQGKAAVTQLKMAKIFIDLGQNSKAAELIESVGRSVALIPEDSDQYLGLQVMLADASIEEALLAYHQRDRQTALTKLMESAEILDSLQDSEVADSALVIRVRYLRTLGMVREQLLEFPAALEAYEKAAMLAQKTIAEFAHLSDPHQSELHFAWASSLNSLAVLQARITEPEDSVATYRIAKQVTDRLIEVHPKHNTYLGLAVTVDTNLGNAAFRSKQWDAALSHYQTAANRNQVLLNSNPDVIAYRQKQAEVLGMLGATEARLGQWLAAREHFDQSMVLALQLGDSPSALAIRLRAANNLARMLNEDLQQTEEAQKLYSDVIAETEVALEKWPLDISFVRTLAVAFGASGNIRLDQADYKQAEQLFEKQKQTLISANKKSLADRELQNLLTLAQRDFSNLHLRQQGYDEAIQALIEIAELPPQSAELAYRSARELMNMHTETAQTVAGPNLITEEEWMQWREEVLERCYQQLELAIQRKFTGRSKLEHEDPIWQPLRKSARFKRILQTAQ
jgi:tetratricopeptide (TPR) repeat protein